MAKQNKTTQPQGTVIEKITGAPIDLSKGKKVISNSTGWSLDIDLKNKKPETKTPDAPIPGISAPLKEEKVSPPTTDEQNAAVVKPVESSLPAVKGIEAAKAPIKIKNIGTDINLDYKAELLLNANKDKNKAVKKYLEETPDNPDVKAKTDELMFVYTQGADTNMDEMFAPNQQTQEEVNNERLDKAKKEAVKSPEILKLYGASNDTEIPYAIQKTSGEGVVIPQLMPKAEVKQYITDNNLDYLLKSSQGYNAPKLADVSDTVSSISKKVSSYEEKLKLDPYGDLVESINKKAKELEAGKPQLELERKKYVATDEDIVSLNTTTTEVSKLIEDINTLSKDEEIIKYNKVEPSTLDDVTVLEEEDEKAYQEWKLTLPENLQYEGDYDLRGFYQKNPTFKAEEGQHLTDEFKRSNHPTFSNESKYYKEGMPSGRWNGDKYIPENRSPKVTEYLTKAQRIMEINGELPTLKQKAQEKLRQYELTNQKELAYKKKLQEFNDLLEKTKKLTPDSFMNKLALKYKDKLTSDIIINEFTKESNRFRYQLLQSAKLVPIIPESSDETLKGILMSRTFQNATKSEKIIILNEYFVSGGLRKTDKQAFFDKYKKFIYTPLDIAIIKQQAIESKKESDSLKALTPAVYKRPVNKTNLSDISLSKYDNNWLGISPFDTDEEERKRVTDELIEKIIAIPETESGIWNDFIKGIQNSSKKNWIPVLGGFIDYNEQRIIKDAFIAKNPTFEQKRLRKIFNDIAQVRAKFHQDDASAFDIGETLFPELIKFAMENTILNGVLGVTASAFKDIVAQKTVIELAKKMKLISVAEAVKMSELPIIYVAKQLTKGAVASQTVALGTSLSQALQMTIPAAQAMADPEMYSESDLKLIVDTLQPRYINYIHSSLNQTIGFGLAGLGHQLERPFGGIKTKLATLLDDYFKVAPQRAVGLYEMIANREVQNTISLAWAYNQAKLMTSTVGGVLKNINQVGIEMLKKAELQSFPAQTVEMHIMAIMHQQVGRYFDPHVEMPELSLYKTGVEAFKVMSPLILTKTLFGASRITLGVGLHMYNLKGTSKIQFDKVDMEMIGAEFIKRNGLHIPTFKRKAKVAFESVLDKILKESRDEILDRDNYENILNEIDHIDTSYGEHKLAKIASRVLDFRVQFENSREAEAGRLFRDHYEDYKKQKETVEGFIISSSVKGYFDSARADELLQTITEEIPRNELDYHISVCKEYERLQRNNLIPDNINLGEYMAREGRKLLNIESIINNYIYSGGVINFEKIRIDIDNTVMSRDKHAYLLEALDAAHTKYIRSENITVDGLSIISNDAETKVQRRYSDTVKERSDKFTQTRGLQDANGNYNLKAVGEDVVFEDTVNPENFINYIVDNLTHIPEPVRQVIFGTLGRNKSLSDADKKMLIDRVSAELQTKLVDNKIEPEEAVKQMALLNEGLDVIGSTYSKNEEGSRPTNGLLLYAYMRGRFHYNSANNRFFLDKFEFEEAMGVINASKNFNNLISTDAITSIENKCVTDSNYTVTEEVDMDKDGTVKSSGMFSIKNKTKLTEKHLIDWFKDINNIDNFVDKGQKKAITQMLLNTANNFVRFGIIDNTIDFLRLLPSVKTLNQRRKAKVTPEQINDDVLYQVKQEVKKQFTSRLQRAIQGISDKKQELTGAQWIIEINKSANKGEGLSQDEMKWTGLRDFLDGRADEVITREKVEQVFNAGLEKITPKVRILDGPLENKLDGDNWADEAALYDIAEEIYNQENPNGIPYEEVTDNDIFLKYSNLAEEKWNSENNQERATRYNKGSRWDYVTQIGGEGYKEVVFYIDNVAPFAEHDSIHFGDKTDGNGALFWTRISDYTNEHGERVRFIEEIQSNRNQELSSIQSKKALIAKREKFITDAINSGEITLTLGNDFKLSNKEVKLSSENETIEGMLLNYNLKFFETELHAKTTGEIDKEYIKKFVIDKIRKEIEVGLRDLPNEENLHNQFEGNNWKNLAAKWIINDAIAHGIDKVELTGAETQTKRGGANTGHVQFYDVTMPNIFKKLGLEQGETKVMTDGVSENFYYINGEKINEEKRFEDGVIQETIEVYYKKINKTVGFLSFEQKQEMIQELVHNKEYYIGKYKDYIKLKERQMERAKEANDTNSYNAFKSEADYTQDQIDYINTIESAEYKAEEGKKTGNTHTFTITDKTKDLLSDKVDLFQTEEGYIQGYFEHLKNQIVLLKDANFSTLMHELGHSFRFMLKVAADSGNTKAAEKLKVFDDFALGEEGKKFFDEEKIEGEQTLDNFKFINELWARSFEKYLWDGTAKGIKDVNFKMLLSQFRDWMKELYVSIKNSALNIKLTPEVRDVFESIIGNKNRLFELKEYITQRLGRPSWRKHLTAELVRDIIEKMKTSKLDPETHQESMLLLNEVINHYKRQYVANKYKANSRLVNPDLQKLMHTPKFLTIEGYEKHIELFTKILNDSRFKWSWVNMGKNLIKARRRVLSNKRDNIEFYTALSELTKVEQNMFTKQKDIEDFTALLNYKPNDVGIAEFKAKVKRFTDMSSEYKKELYKERLEKEARAKDENEDEIVPVGISDLGLSETRAEREKNVNSTREYAVQVGNVDTMKETESIFFGLDTSRMTDSELNHYNSILTNVIRSKGKFEVTNEIVDFNNTYTARLTNESLEESISDYWRLKLKELNYKATNVNPLTRNLLNRALNPHGFGVLSNYNLRDTLNFLDGIVDDYSGEIVKTIFEPLSENHDKMRTILNNVFGKINQFKNGKDSLKEGAFNKVGVAWLLSQKPEIKIEANDLDPNKNTFIDEETGMPTTIWEKIGISENEVRKNFLPDETISPEEFYEKDNNGVWNLKENLTPSNSEKVEEVKTGLLDYFRNIKKDSAFDELVSIGENMGIGVKEYDGDSPLAANFNGTDVTINKRFGKPSTNNIAHEVIHGILHKLTSNEYKGSSLDVKLQKFKKELFDYIDNKGIDNLGLKPELKILYLDYIRKSENSQEIVTFAFTNGQFHNFLSSIKSEGVANKSKTLWGKLKDIFKSTLQEVGIKSKLDDLVDLLDSEVPLKAVEQSLKEQPIQESRYEIYKKMLDLRLNYLKDSIMVSFGEKPDNMSEEEFDYHLREMTKTTEFLSTSRHVAKFGKPSFFEAAISEIQSKRLSLLEATGFNSVKEFLQSDIELSDKESQFMALGVSLFDQLQDGQFSGGRTMKETADAYTANNIVPYTGIRNYAPIIRFNTTTLEQAEDVLGTMPGQQKTGEFMGIRTGLNLSNNFVRQRKQNVSTINTNSFEMIEKRFDQELFYILHEPHRLFLRELLNKQNGLFGKDKYGNSKKDSGKVDNITTDYIRNMIALYYRRGATNAKLKVRNSAGYATINNIVNDYKIASLGLVRNSFAQMTSTWMAQENLLGSPLERMQDIANGYGDVFGSMGSDIIGNKSDADNMIETYAQEVAFRGLTDYNLGTGKQSPTLGNLMKSYRDGSMETEQGYFGNLLRQFKDADRSRERVLLPMVFFDRLAARATFFGAYRNYCRNQGIELSYKNPDIDAVNFARDVVRATQHTDNELFKPGVLGGVSARENANPFSDNNFNDNSPLFELLRSGYWNFKSFTLVEKNNMAIKLLKATNKDGIHGTGKDKLDYATALAYNITGNMLFNYAKAVAKSYFAAMSVYTAYNMGLGRASNEDDNESILSKLIDGDWSEMNHINTQAKNKAEDAKNEIWDTEVSASDNVTMSPSEKRLHGLFYNTMKSIVGQYGLNEMSDYAFRQLVLAGHNKLVEMTDGGELDEKFVKTYAGADKIDFLGLYSGLFGLPYLVGSDQTDKGTVSNDMINLAKSVGPGKDVEPEHLVSALQFVTSALGYGIYSKYPVHYPAINKWLRENRKEEVKLTPEQVEHNNSLDEVVTPVNQGDGLEDESDNGE